MTPIVMPMIKPLRLFLPPWRLGTSIKNAHEESVEALSELFVLWGWGFAGLVILGVAGEFAIAAYHPAYDSWLDRWGPAFADLLIAFGIAGEVITGVMSHICQSELTRRSKYRLAEVEMSNGFLEAYRAFHRAGFSVGCGDRSSISLGDIPLDISIIMVGVKRLLAGGTPSFMAGLATPKNDAQTNDAVRESSI